MTPRPTVFVSLEPWDEVWRRNQHLVTRLRADGVLGDVLYVEPSVDPLHNLRLGRWPQRGRGLRPLADQAGITALEMTKRLPRRFDTGQDARWARAIVTAATRLGLRDPLLWVNDPRGAELVDLVDWPALYDITDDWLLAPRPEAELRRLQAWERTLLERCAEVIVCSPALVDSRSKYRKVTLIPNAVDLDAYAVRRPRPDDLPSGPIAMYVGTLHDDRLDVGLCCATAEALGDSGAQLVLVGPDALTTDEQTRLDEAGVVRLGPQPAHNIPAYLQHADVLVVPHLVTPFTESLDPIKAYEYAAASRPIVSTPVAGFRGLPGASVVASSAFPKTVQNVITGNSLGIAPVKGVATWQDRATRFAVLIRGILGQH